LSRFIEIVEVGPRDGLQNEKAALEVGDKLDFIRRLEACGARRIETVSFVNERRVPQMAGAEAIMAALPHSDGRSRIGLVLNERGWDRALAAKVDEANVATLARTLRPLGVLLRRVVVVMDDIDSIVHEVRELSKAHDWLFTSGGIGPTHDDVTVEAVAKAFGESVGMTYTLGIGSPTFCARRSTML